MANQNEPIDFSAISFDDVIGEGAEGLETAEQEPQDVEEYDDDDIVDEDPREYGDEDFEDGVDEYESDLNYSVEDDYDDDEEEYDDDDEGQSQTKSTKTSPSLTRSLTFSELKQNMNTRYCRGTDNYVRDVSKTLRRSTSRALRTVPRSTSSS